MQTGVRVEVCLTNEEVIECQHKLSVVGEHLLLDQEVAAPAEQPVEEQEKDHDYVEHPACPGPRSI